MNKVLEKGMIIIPLIGLAALLHGGNRHTYKADINKDGIEDKVVAKETILGTEFYSYLGKPASRDLEFRSRGYSGRNIAGSMRFEDYDHDGSIDMVTETTSPHRKYIFRVVGYNSGQGDFRFEDVGY